MTPGAVYSKQQNVFKNHSLLPGFYRQTTGRDLPGPFGVSERRALHATTLTPSPAENGVRNAEHGLRIMEYGHRKLGSQVGEKRAAEGLPCWFHCRLTEMGKGTGF